jgi:hypothetical protein
MFSAQSGSVAQLRCIFYPDMQHMCSGDALRKLDLPPDATRVLFKTDNSAK